MHFWKDFRKDQLKYMLSFVIIFALFLAMIVTNFDFGYDAYLGKTKIGSVETFAQGDAALQAVNDRFRQELDGLSAVSGELSYYLKLVPEGGFTSDEALQTALGATSPALCRATAVYEGGQLLFAVADEQAAKQVLAAYQQQFVTEATLESRILGDLSVREDYVVPTMILPQDAALDLLNSTGTLQVATSERTVEAVAIPHATQTVEDASLYEGNVAVQTAGADGEKQVEKIVAKRNGAVASSYVVAENIVTTPITQVEAVGTKERPAGVGTGSFTMPASGTLSSRYGSRWGRQHKGIDIAAPNGTDIYAADEGVVLHAGWDDGGYGNMVKIDHGNGYVTLYAHASEVLVSAGQTVGKGDLIARVGSTGRSTGNHLHFELMQNGVQVNPESFLN